MSIEAELHKSEYEALRQETNTHQNFANAIIGLELTSLGLGISLGNKSPYVLAGLAIVTTMLWLSYLDHLTGMFRIAIYTALVLRPRLSELAEQPVLSWEVYMRRMRATPMEEPGVGVSLVVPAERLKEPSLGLTYVSIFFAVTPPTFTCMYIYDTVSRSQVSAVMAVVALVTLIFWIFAIVRSASISRWMRHVDNIIISYGAQDDPAPKGVL